MKKVKLGEILKVKRGTSLSGDYYSTSGEKVRLTLGNFNYPNGGFKKNVSKDNIYFTGDVKPEYILKKGDIITPLTEQVAGLLGETARIPTDGVYIQSGDIGLVIPNEKKLNHRFAYYLLPSPIVKKQLGAAAQQTKIRHTSPEKIEDCEVWIPDLYQQKKAGEILDSINDKISINNRIISELESLTKTIYDYWFMQFDFPDENGKPYRSSGGKMIWNDELKREIPEGWKIKNLLSIADFENGLACQKYRPLNNEESFPVIKIKEMENGITNETERVSKDIPNKNIVVNGDILFSWSATLKVIIWNGSKAGLNQHIFKVTPKKHSQKYFVFNELSSYIINFQRIAQARKTTMGHITRDHLEQSKIIIPRENVIKEFCSIVEPFYKEIAILEEEKQQLISLRNYLLPLLMNGQVKINDEY